MFFTNGALTNIDELAKIQQKHYTGCMKLFLILVCISLLVVGSVTRNLVINMLGAGAFVLSAVVDLIENINSMRTVHDEKGISEHSKSPREAPTEKLASRLQGIVALAGLAGMMIGQVVKDEDVWSWPGISI